MSVIDDILNLKEPELRHCEFCLRHDLRERWAETKSRHTQAKIRAQARGADAAQVAEFEAVDGELQDLRAEIGPHMLRFEFTAVEREEFDRIKKACRPTEPQRTEARKAGQQPPEWNVDTFSPALVAAACTKVIGPSGVNDGISIDDANAIWASDRWNQAERAELFHTALGAYMSRTDLEGWSLGKGSERIPD